MTTPVVPKPRPVANLSVEPIPPQSTDPLLYRILIAGLVSAVLLTLVAISALAIIEHSVPEGLVAIGSACAGGLVGLLVPAPTK